MRDLIDYETCCFNIYEDPEFLEAMSQKVGDFNVAIIEACCEYDCFGELYSADDLGFKTSTMIAPETIRQYIIPWHKKMADAAKARGKLVFLLGGVDMDLLSRQDEATIRAKVREILDVCVPGDGYFLGSGNCVTSDIPLDNYLAMLAEGRCYK